MDARLLEILVCPVCKGPLDHRKAQQELVCKACKLAYPIAERARATSARRVCIATDHEAVRAAAQAHGCEVLMTRADHASGTDRLAEAAAQLGVADDAILVNVQGDEPLIDPAIVERVAAELEGDPGA
ncbi:MAG: kdsB, partial [Proteobacteria bacterium]|nr:kdsB [Pseudomonadota bacterium]